jgi:non-heme chloroperoxidase
MADQFVRRTRTFGAARTRMLSLAVAIAASAAIANAQQPGAPARRAETTMSPRVVLQVRTTPSGVVRVVRVGHAGGAPPLVLLYGWSVSADIWDDVANALAVDRQVFLVDSRSQGRSSISLSDNTPENRAADLARIFAKLEIVRPIVIAWSQGVQDLAAYVSLYGDSTLTASIMVDATPSAGVATLAESPEFARQILRNMGVYQAHPREYLHGMMDAIIGDPHAATLRSRLAGEASATPVSVGVAMQISDLLTVDRRGARFTRPLLIIVAADGPMAGDMKQYADKVGARFESIANARHALFIDRPDEFLRLVRRFAAAQARDASTPADRSPSAPR